MEELKLQPTSQVGVGFVCPACAYSYLVNVTHLIREGKYVIGQRLVCPNCEETWDDYNDGS